MPDEQTGIWQKPAVKLALSFLAGSVFGPIASHFIADVANNLLPNSGDVACHLSVPYEPAGDPHKFNILVFNNPQADGNAANKVLSQFLEDTQLPLIRSCVVIAPFGSADPKEALSNANHYAIGLGREKNADIIIWVQPKTKDTEVAYILTRGSDDNQFGFPLGGEDGENDGLPSIFRTQVQSISLDQDSSAFKGTTLYARKDLAEKFLDLSKNYRTGVFVPLSPGHKEPGEGFERLIPPDQLAEMRAQNTSAYIALRKQNEEEDKGFSFVLRFMAMQVYHDAYMKYGDEDARSGFLEKRHDYLAPGFVSDWYEPSPIRRALYASLLIDIAEKSRDCAEAKEAAEFMRRIPHDKQLLWLIGEYGADNIGPRAWRAVNAACRTKPNVTGGVRASF